MLTVCDNKELGDWMLAVETALQQNFGANVDGLDHSTMLAQAKQCYEQGLTSHETAWELVYNAAN